MLLKAECILYGAPGNVDAIVNQVRERAGLSAKSGITLAQLLDERRREFAGEGNRWLNLHRSAELITIVNAWMLQKTHKTA